MGEILGESWHFDKKELCGDGQLGRCRTGIATRDRHLPYGPARRRSRIDSRRPERDRRHEPHGPQHGRTRMTRPFGAGPRRRPSQAAAGRSRPPLLRAGPCPRGHRRSSPCPRPTGACRARRPAPRRDEAPTRHGPSWRVRRGGRGSFRGHPRAAGRRHRNLRAFSRNIVSRFASPVARSRLPGRRAAPRISAGASAAKGVGRIDTPTDR